jgi:ATP-binding cassette subfamily B protein
MARATDDMNQLSNMIVPGGSLVLETVMGFIVPISFIATIRPELTLTPLAFVVVFVLLVRRYLRRLSPVIAGQREQYGKLNAGLEETISGIEVVKASARELHERARFYRNARRYRDLFVAQGDLEARYLPLLIYGLALGLTFLHALLLYQAGQLSIGEIVSVMGLVNVLRFPTFISIYAFSTTQSGIAGARRILQIIRGETDLDENNAGYSALIRGEIRFEEVSFGYEGDAWDEVTSPYLPFPQPSTPFRSTFSLARRWRSSGRRVAARRR